MFYPPAGALQMGHPVTPGSLILVNVTDQEGRLQRLHLLRVGRVLGKGGNGLVWRVGWCRSYQHLLVNPEQPWEGININCQAAAVDAMQKEQLQQGYAAGEVQQPQGDDRALKMALRHSEHDIQYQATIAYECHYMYHWNVLQEESSIAMAAHSGNVIQSYGAGVACCLNGEVLPCMLLELAEMGTLAHYVYGLKYKDGRLVYGLSGPLTRDLIRGIARGLTSLHVDTLRFHRDLKCSNILLFGTPDNLVPKIADFGSCRSTTIPTQITAPMTAAFRAPEQQHGRFQDMRLDTFLLGLLFLEMRFRMLPFAWYGMFDLPPLQPSEYLAELKNPACLYNNGCVVTGRVKLTAEEMAFLEKCLAPDVAARPPVAHLLANSEFLAE
jgi:serine/threonine protein kinase